MSRELMDEIVGPMPLQEFLKEFCPTRPVRLGTVNPDHFDKIPTRASATDIQHWGKKRGKDFTGVSKIDGKKPLERDMYEPINSLIQAVFTKHDCVISADHPDANSDLDKKWRIDGIIYRKNRLSTEERKGTRRAQLDKASLVYEVKPSDCRVFSDTDAAFLVPSDNAGRIRGQLAATATEIMSRQHRTHCFLILFNDPEARFIRCDRAGMVVSEAVNFRTEPNSLVQALKCLDNLNDEGMGMDPTVTDATPEEAKLAERQLGRPAWKPTKSRPVKVLTIPTPDGKGRKVLAWGALSDAYSLSGRSTRAYPVWDLTDKKVRFLKDSWRVHGLEPESEILQRLEKHQVPHVPHLVAGGDVDDQETMTQKFIKKPWVKSSPAKLDKRRHHRLLEDFIPNRLEDCNNPKVMLTAVFHAFLAHEGAFSIGILHRDISDNNVLLTDNDEGVLTDWDLCIVVKYPDGSPRPLSARQRYRTGTWAYMSVRLLRNIEGPDAAHELSDDLESFAWLVLDIAVGMLEWESHGHTAQSMNEVFSDAKYINSRWMGGDFKQQALQTRGYMSLAKLCFLGNQALTMWWQTVHTQLATFYNHLSGALNLDNTAQGVPLQNHTEIKKAFEKALNSEDWPRDQTPLPQQLVNASPEPRHPQHGRRATVPPSAEVNNNDPMGSIDEEGQPRTSKKSGVSASMDSSGKPRTRSKRVVPPSDRTTRGSSRNASSEAGPSSQPGSSSRPTRQSRGGNQSSKRSSQG
ncbi:hypothetical protein BKA70DRAFT_745094 [Coprinopsis sp. MPI-PUGE-AT-0042]|nr:hypothetical protein BKA70DRAFT_745094 [Coprinopsis sp. MPI-PUGE-AT-0042]